MTLPLNYLPNLTKSGPSGSNLHQSNICFWLEYALLGKCESLGHFGFCVFICKFSEFLNKFFYFAGFELMTIEIVKCLELGWPQWWSLKDKTQQRVHFCSEISSRQIFFYLTCKQVIKKCIIWLSKSIFNIKNHLNLSAFF